MGRPGTFGAARRVYVHGDVVRGVDLDRLDFRRRLLQLRLELLRRSRPGLKPSHSGHAAWRGAVRDLGAVSFLYVSENVRMAGAVSGVSGALRLAPVDIISSTSCRSFA